MGAFLAIAIITPLIIAVLTSLKNPFEAYDATNFLPKTPQWANYWVLLTEFPFGRWLWNSIFIAVLATVGTVLSCFMAGYAFARFRFRGSKPFFLVTIATLALPLEVTLVPSYVIFRGLGWLDTYLPLIVPYWFGAGAGTAFYIFLFRQFILALPREFGEAALIDGANVLQVARHIVFPMCRPVIVAAAVISFVNQWNEFLAPLIYLNSPDLYTVTIGLSEFQSQTLDQPEPQVHMLMGAAMISLIPPLILFVFFQRYFINAALASGLKG